MSTGDSVSMWHAGNVSFVEYVQDMASGMLHMQAGALAGPVVLKHLPPSINAKLTAKLESALVGGRASPPEPAVAEAARRRASGTSSAAVRPKGGARARATMPEHNKAPAVRPKENGGNSNKQTAWSNQDHGQKAPGRGERTGLGQPSGKPPAPAKVRQVQEPMPGQRHLHAAQQAVAAQQRQAPDMAAPPPSTSHFSMDLAMPATVEMPYVGAPGLESLD